MPSELKISNEVTMAQLCLDTTAIIENNVYEIHVFEDGSGGNTTFTSNHSVQITADDFLAAFYGRSKGKSAFKAAESDASGVYNYYELAMAGHYQQYNVAGVTGVDFTDEVMNLWKSETCTAWSTCSEMAIRKELINAHNFKDLANCNVCCALNYCDLVSAIGSVEANGDGTGSSVADIALEDKIALSILLKQSYPGTSDVELIIHYEISANFV